MGVVILGVRNVGNRWKKWFVLDLVSRILGFHVRHMLAESSMRIKFWSFASGHFLRLKRR